MGWLAQNWIWIALVIGAYLFFSRAGGCGMSMGGCGTGATRGRGGSGATSTDRQSTSITPFDPVSRRAIVGAAAFSSIHQGRAYYFETSDNRDAFERDPGRYLATSANLGRSLESQKTFGGTKRRQTRCS